MIISGGMGKDSSSVEVIAPSGNVSCTLQNLTQGRNEHTQNKNFICGGSLATLTAASASLQSDANIRDIFCQNLTSSGWVTTHERYPRWSHSSWAVDDGIILMGGNGYSGGVETSTEIMKFDGTVIDRPFLLKHATTM